MQTRFEEAERVILAKRLKMNPVKFSNPKNGD